MIIGHGGNKQNLAASLGCSADEIIDMSSNLNPLGPPEQISQVICDNLLKIKSLPEPDATSMRRGFAKYHGIDEKNVVAGNGTTWFIYTIPKALDAKKILIVGPTYSDYKDACIMHGIQFEHFFTTPENDFELDIEKLSQATKNADMIFICNPNNPTGSLISKEKLTWLLENHKNTFFIVDESYLPFVDQAQEISFVSDTKYNNLIVLSSMSKIFTIPGLRTGFLSAAEPICEKIMNYYQPWSVNALAQAVIVDIFDHPEKIDPFYRQTREYIQKEKQKFLDSLEGVKEITCFSTSTYFVLARLTGQVRAKKICRRIGEHKILIRDCANFIGLSDEYVRFSLKQRKTNLLLANLIKEVLGHV
ncbi:MAG: aminotransferase class I/II-fold pyridoxal phosphate-dependent enzyme [Desulfobacula sp.]|nr:aminotransferase class I/II-fold pyridoxal phosphate-dependent enzyme [Desulfobacula sp.]